jgi:hypothetical protein
MFHGQECILEQFIENEIQEQDSLLPGDNPTS